MKLPLLFSPGGQVLLRDFPRRALKAAPSSVHESLLRKAIGISDADARFRSGLPSVWGSLGNLAQTGFRPGGIIDVGAHIGDWARQAAKVFPGAPIHMIEAQRGLEPQLRATGFPYTITLLGPESRAAVPFYVNPDGPTSGSVLEETTSFQEECVSLPMRRLDDLGLSLLSPLLLKLDVQGFELEVLAGAPETLRQTEVIVSEVALLEYNKGAPLMHEVIAFLAERDFVPYDVCEGLRRFEDRALFQLDMIFARKDSLLRAHKKFWEREV